MLLAARPLAAQGSLVDHLGLDRLQVVSIGLSGGRILPSQVEATSIAGVSADYGEVAPGWHILANASFWHSHFRQRVVDAFVDSLNAHLAGSGTAHVTSSRVAVYDATFGVEARYTRQGNTAIKPFAGLGLAAHVIDAGGPLIDGTFVERALDNVGTGVFATGGLSIRPFSYFGIEAAVRGDLLSGFRSSQVRVGATYYFGHLHGTTPPTSGS